MVCFVFSFTQICGLLISLPQLSNYDPTSFEYYVTFIYSKVVNTLFLFNSACNFFIYVLFNPKFRKLIVQNFFKSKPKQQNICFVNCLILLLKNQRPSLLLIIFTKIIALFRCQCNLYIIYVYTINKIHLHLLILNCKINHLSFPQRWLAAIG